MGLIAGIIYGFTQLWRSRCDCSTSGPRTSGDDQTLILSDSAFCFALCCLHVQADTPQVGVGWPRQNTQKETISSPGFLAHLPGLIKVHWTWLDPSFHPWLWPWESSTLTGQVWAPFLLFEPEDVYEFLIVEEITLLTSCILGRRNRCSLSEENRYRLRQNFLVPIWPDSVLAQASQNDLFYGFC